MTLAEAMKTHRHSLRMGMQSYANYMGINFVTVKKIENGGKVQERVLYKLVDKEPQFKKFL